MFCPNCGKSNPDDSKFCEGCGVNMTDPTISQTPVTPPPPVTPVAPVYQAAPQAAHYAGPQMVGQNIDLRSKPLSVLGFIGTMIVFCIPLVNIIMLFVWAFSSNTNINRKNYCRAILILAVIGIVLSILMAIFMMPLIISIMDQMGLEFSSSFSY